MSFAFDRNEDDDSNARNFGKNAAARIFGRKGVGHAFLDDDDDEDSSVSFSLDKKDDQTRKSGLLDSSIEDDSLQIDQNVREGRYHQEFMKIARLGHGGFGSVDLARHKLDCGLYAVKKIRFRRCRSDGKLGKKLTREIVAMNELSHPNIVRYHGSWVEDDVSPNGTPPASSANLIEVDDDEEDEIGEDEDSVAARVVNADDDDSEDESVEEDSLSSDTVLFSEAPFSMEEDSKSKSKRHKKKHSSPKSWKYGTLYIQMQYYRETLDGWLDSPPRRKHVCPHVSKDIFVQIVEALHYMHSKGYIHRDLKPANIFLTSREEEEGDCPSSSEDCKCESCGANGCGKGFIVSVGDFGLTTLTADSKTNPSDEPEQTSDTLKLMNNRNPSTGFTFSPVLIPKANVERTGSCEAIAQSMPRLFTPGMAADRALMSRSRSNSRASSQSCKHTTGVGSMSYASPEQISGQFYDEKTDIFSLGIVCYQLFSPPFSTGMERAEEFRNVRAGHIPLSFIKTYPEIAEFIKRCVSPDPAKRPSTSEILAMSIWEPPPCMCAKDSSYSVTIPRSKYICMQNEIARLQQELALAKKQLANYTNNDRSKSQSQPAPPSSCSSDNSRVQPQKPVFVSPRKPLGSRNPIMNQSADRSPLIFGK